MAKPLLAEMTPVPETLKVGVHIRMGDSGLSNGMKRNDERYPLGCGFASAYQALVQTLWLALILTLAFPDHIEELISACGLSRLTRLTLQLIRP